MKKPIDFTNEESMEQLWKNMLNYSPVTEVSESNKMYEPDNKYYPTNKTINTFNQPGTDITSLGRQDNILSAAYSLGTGFGQRQKADVFSGGINWGLDLRVATGTKASLPEGDWEVIEVFGGSEPNSGFIGNGTNRGYGNSVLARNRKTGEMVRYSHLNQVNVKPGQLISGGQVIGLKIGRAHV